MENLAIEDRWILDRLSAAIRETTERLEGFRYCDAAQRVRSFAWSDFCDWYVEAVKFRLARAPDFDDARAARPGLAPIRPRTRSLCGRGKIISDSPIDNRARGRYLSLPRD
jgi:valyl-tRNA synthetase